MIAGRVSRVVYGTAVSCSQPAGQSTSLHLVKVYRFTRRRIYAILETFFAAKCREKTSLHLISGRRSHVAVERRNQWRRRLSGVTTICGNNDVIDHRPDSEPASQPASERRDVVSTPRARRSAVRRLESQPSRPTVSFVRKQTHYITDEDGRRPCSAAAAAARCQRQRGVDAHTHAHTSVIATTWSSRDISP